MKYQYKLVFVLIILVISGALILSKSIPIISHQTIAPLITEKSQTDYITVEMTYPESSEKKYPEMFSFIQKSKKLFLDSFGNISPSDAKIMDVSKDRKYSYILTTKIATSTKTVTYILYDYEDTGGAHGITTVNTFTYDNNGKYLILDNILISPYLDKISVFVRQYLYDYLKEDSKKYQIDDGTKPIAENYSTWYLTDTNIVFIFGQYSVGPYTTGIQEFPLDKKLIKDIILLPFK